ncbi:MAG: TRAP transporter small permease subunit [Hormoscilla sp. GM102CHS1]|nr:TRAP transporter small permease subunit [Hormoscilla sp. GM102CHS1]
MQKLLRLSKIIDRINQSIGQLTLWLVLIMILVGVWNVIGRYLGNAIGQNLTSNSLIEAQWYLFDIIFLVSAAYALKHNEHVRVDMLYNGWPPKRKALVNLIGTLLFLIPFSILAIYFSWQAVYNSWAILEASPDPDGLPRYPIKTMIPIAFALLILQGISEAIKNCAIFTGKLPSREEKRDAL